MSRRGTVQPKPNYAVGERPWCFHGEMLYEAKILEVEQDETGAFKYRVHYKGWKATWDDVVDEERLRKANDENRELAMTLNRQVKDAQKVNKPDKSKKKGLPSDFGSARGSEERSGTAQATGRGQKRGRNMEIDEVGNFILPAAKKLRPSEILPGPVADPLETKTGTAIPTDEDPEDNAHRRPQTVHSLIGTRLYSPTESLAPYLESDWTNVRSIDDIPNIRYRPKIPATTVKKPSKKRPAPLDFDEEDAPLNESLANFEKRRDRHDAKLDKRIKAVCDYIQGDVQEHPDFPHPVNRQNYPVDEKGRPLPYKAPVNPHPRPPSGRIRKKTAKARALKSKKKTNNDTPKQEESFHTRPMIKIPVPDYIKSLLVDDWEEVTKNLSLVPLPAPKPVNQIIDEYYAEEKEKRFEGSADMDFLDEVRQGLKEYFEVSLGRMLLYRFERQQFLEAKAKWAKGDAKGWEGKEGAGDVYGAEHLCRMIVALPEMIAQTNMDRASVNRLREEMTKFLQWLSRNTKTYFAGEYEVAGAEYVEKTKAGELDG